MSYLRRLEALEQARAPRALEPKLMLTVESDVEAAEARFRALNNWPDDDLHPLKVYMIRIPGLNDAKEPRDA